MDQSNLMDQLSNRGSIGSHDDRSGASNRIVRSKVSLELHLLPFDVLRDIMSRLSLKEVARMSVLSPEWKRLRICHPDLVFTKDTFFSSNTTKKTKRASVAAKFITKVDNVLHPFWSPSTTTTATLDKFVVKFGLGRNHSDHVDRWICFSTASRAKHIALDFELESRFCSEDDKYVFPFCNLSGPNGSCVRSLDLRYVSLKLPSNFSGIRNLKKLTLHSVSVSVSDFESLLLSCALLESLNIENIKWSSIERCFFPSLCIHKELSRLQYLRMRTCDLDITELHAPNLTTIDLDGNQFQLVLVESLKLLEATFTSYRRYRTRANDALGYVFNKLPTDLPHVHRLFLDLGLETSVRSCSKTDTRFMKLRYPNINFTINGSPQDPSWVMGLVKLLELTPLLEELELHMNAHGYVQPDSRLVKALQGHPHRHLRNAYMTGFCSLVGVAELALYILRNATMLERMVVDSVVRNGYGNSNPDQLYSVSKASEFAPPSPHEQEMFGMNKDGNSNPDQLYSVSKASEFAPPSPHEQDMFGMNKDRRFAKEYLDREEYRHVLTIL